MSDPRPWAPTGPRALEARPEAVHGSVLDTVGATPLVELGRLFARPGVQVLAKLELMNPGGSMKDRSARYIVASGLADGSIPPGSRLVESSSGNFGVAVAMAAQLHGLSFTCVVDRNASAANVTIMRGLGADVEVVDEPDEAGGYLHTRLARVHELLATTAGHGVDQPVRQRAELARALPRHRRRAGRPAPRPADPPRRGGVDDGQPAGLRAPAAGGVRPAAGGRRRRRRLGDLRGRGGYRELPGLGSSRVPELHSPDEIDRVEHVDDATAAEACRELLATEAIFAGGSTGAVVTAVARLLDDVVPPARIVAIFPDRGDRYLDRVYDDAWLDRARARRVALSR